MISTIYIFFSEGDNINAIMDVILSLLKLHRLNPTKIKVLILSRIFQIEVLFIFVNSFVTSAVV